MEGPNPHTQKDDGQQEAEWEYCICSEAQEVVMFDGDAVCLFANVLQCFIHVHNASKAFQMFVTSSQCFEVFSNDANML